VFCVLSWLGLRAVSGSRRPRVRRRRRLDDLETGILPAMPQLASLLPAAASASSRACCCCQNCPRIYEGKLPNYLIGPDRIPIYLIDLR
jgi:hypothetical protein